MATRVEQLRELLLRCDTALITCAERDVAGLSREKRMILAELDELEAVEVGGIDELKQRRNAKRRSTAAAASPGPG
jgi:hypothetical protein